MSSDTNIRKFDEYVGLVFGILYSEFPISKPSYKE